MNDYVKLAVLFYIFSPNVTWSTGFTYSDHHPLKVEQRRGEELAKQEKPNFYERSYKEIEYPYYAFQDADEAEGQVNRMQVLNNGTASLYKRLEMLDRAQETIELEYFIFEPNEPSSQVLLQKLIEKARQGVQVRILVDKSGTVFKFNQDYVEAIKRELAKTGDEENFNVRFYNPASMIRISSTNFRNHRKLIVIDGQEAMTGGRNIEDKYFDMDHTYNFHDRDVWVEGPIVQAMKDSFEEFWKHEIVERPKRVEGELESSLTAWALSLNHSPYLKEIKEKIYRVGAQNIQQTDIHECRKTTFISDRPGGNFFQRMKLGSFKEDYAVVERAFGELILSSRESVNIASPYFLLNSRARAVKDYVMANNIDVNVFTNSLKSTDAIYVSGPFYKDSYKWQQDGMNLYIHSGDYIENGTEVIDEGVKQSIWGVHSKSFVIDDETTYIGTYNIDNRSAFYNTEMGIICEENPAIAADVMQSFKERAMQNSLKIVDKNTAVSCDGKQVSIYDGVSGFKAIMTRIVGRLVKRFVPLENLM